MMTNLVTIRAALVALWLLPAVCAAQTTWHVDDDACPGSGTGTEIDPFCSIQAAIDAAVDGDEIVVAPGTYYEAIDLLGKAVYLHSTDGADVTTLDGVGLDDRIITCDDSEGPDTVIEGFTLTNGTVPAGAKYEGSAVLNSGASPTIRDCMFVDNEAYAVVNVGGAPMIADSEFIGNGGGIHGEEDSGSIVRCVFTGQELSDVFCVGGSATVADSSFLNTKDRTSTAVYLSGTTDAVISGCVFSELKSSGGYSGGLTSYGSNTLVEDCVFRRLHSSNSAASNGGSAVFQRCEFIENETASGGGAAVTCANYSTTRFESCVFAGNAASGDGGAIQKIDGTVDVNNCVFVGNTARWFGSAIKDLGTYVDYPLTVTNSVFVSNDAFNGAISVHTAEFTMKNCISYANVGVFGYSLFLLNEDAAHITYSVVEAAFVGAGNVQVDPMFVRMPNDGGDGWADNPDTPDIDERDNNDYGDLRLLPESPCVNAGDPAIGWSPGEADLDGHRRILCGRIDMGAYEFGIGDVNCDGAVEVSDLAEWSSCAFGPGIVVAGETCGAFDFNADGAIDLSDFAGYQAGIQAP